MTTSMAPLVGSLFRMILCNCMMFSFSLLECTSTAVLARKV